MTIDWDAELSELDLSGLDGPPNFGQRLAEDALFPDLVSTVIRAWSELDASCRQSAIASLCTCATAILSDCEDPQVIAGALLEKLRRAAAAGYGEGNLPEATLREMLHVVLPRASRAPAGPRGLRYPISYYADALRFSLAAWSRRWWPGLDVDQDHDRLLERRKRARRTARRCLGEADQP